jgi:hypothetical protein
MSRDNRPKLAIEYLEQQKAKELSKNKDKTLEKPELEIF